MRKTFGRVKTGWVYLLGMGLMVGFSCLAVTDGNVSVQGAKDSAPVHETGKKNEVKKESPSDEAPLKKNESSKTQSKAQTSIKTTQTTVKQTQTSSIIPSQTAAASTPVATPPIQKDAIDMYITGLGNYKVEISEGENAFQALQAAANKNGFSVEYKIYSWGVMITKIGATKAQGTYYWALYHNGGYSMVGASDLILKNKDKVEWRYESW